MLYSYSISPLSLEEERSAACQQIGSRGLWVCLVADFFDIFDFETPLQNGQYTIEICEILENLDSSDINRDRGEVRDGPGAF